MEKVTRYKSKDGKIFETVPACQRHENLQEAAGNVTKRMAMDFSNWKITVRVLTFLNKEGIISDEEIAKLAGK